MAHSKLYIQIMNSREWRQLRVKKLQLNPFCEECLKQDPPIVTPAQAIHHLVEIESARDPAVAWSLGLSIGNCESVCFQCHRKLHSGSNTKVAHKKRNEDRLAAWVSAQMGTGSRGVEE